MTTEVSRWQLASNLDHVSEPVASRARAAVNRAVCLDTAWLAGDCSSNAQLELFGEGGLGAPRVIHTHPHIPSAFTNLAPPTCLSYFCCDSGY